MNNKFKDWCNKNFLEVEQLEPSIYKIENKLFLLIEGEGGKILSSKNKLLLSSSEEKLIKNIDFIVFLWGENFYYTSKEKIKDPEFNIFRYFGSLNIGLPFLGVHGKYELLSGSREYEDWCKKAKFLGCSSLGICERNTLAGVLDFQQTCKNYGLFSIIGETIVIKDKKGKLLSGKCFVKNNTGWKNLLLVNTQINVLSVDQCIEEEKLLELGEGLIFIFHPSYFPFSEEKIELYKRSFSQCYFQLETCSYTNEESDRNFLLNTGKYLSSTLLKPILISDAYYLEEEDSHIRSILSFLSEKRDLLSTNQYFKNFQQEIVILSQLFEKDEDFQTIINSCVESLVEVERDCKSFEIQTGVFKLPKYKMTEEESQKYETNEDLFYDLIDKNFPLKVPPDKEEKYSERLVHELSVIQRGGFIDYFLILWDIVRWCKENDILTGIGRGSAGGSLVAYILEITRIDPIEYNLLFERFLNEGRLGKIVDKSYIIINEEVEFERGEIISVNRDSQKISIPVEQLREGDLIEI